MTDCESSPAAARILIQKLDSTSRRGPGQIVRLNSGGPLGIVSDRTADGRLHVVWLNEAFDRSTLPAACVTVLGELHPVV